MKLNSLSNKTTELNVLGIDTKRGFGEAWYGEMLIETFINATRIFSIRNIIGWSEADDKDAEINIFIVSISIAQLVDDMVNNSCSTGKDKVNAIIRNQNLKKPTMQTQWI